MNGKYPAKARVSLAAAVALTVWLIPVSATADFGNLSQQLRVQQHKGRFQLMLEQVQESARQRAATAGTTSVERTGASTPVVLGDWTESLRLDSLAVTGPEPREIDSELVRRLKAEQAYERDQRRILDHRQQRHALIAGPRTSGPAAVNSYAAKRRNLVRYGAQNQQQSLQRKLRR